MEFIDLIQIMGMDEPIIVRHKSDNYHTTPNKFMQEHPDLCHKRVVFQSVRESTMFNLHCIMIRLSGIDDKEEKENADC